MRPTGQNEPPAAPPSRFDRLLLRRGAGPLLAVLLALPALLPLLRSGFFVSDDGRFHVYRIASLAKAWQAGVLHPRLFPEFGFDYGQAVLNFYSPLSYWPGAVLASLGVGPAEAAQVVIALGFLLAALAAYGYVRYLWGPAAGLMAAVAYTYFPYHLADAYTRGAIPEHFAFIFPPLILWAYTAAFLEEDPWPPLLWGTLAWAGLVLTHNLTTLLIALAAVAHLALMAAWTRRVRRLAAAAGSLALAVALSATYWLPVLAESSAVGISLGPSRGYADHLLAAGNFLSRSLSYVYRDANGLGLLYPLDWLTLGVLLLACGLLLWRRLAGRGLAVQTAAGRPVNLSVPLAFHLGLAAVAIFMMTGVALPLWDLLMPLLGHLQYPWRFLVLVAVGVMGAAGSLPLLVPRLPKVLWIAVLWVASLVVALPLLRLEPLAIPAAEAWSPQRMWQEDAEAGQIGATWTAEFLPLAVTEQRWALGRPREAAADGPPLAPAPQLSLDEVRYAGLTARVQADSPFTLRLHQFHLPGWNAAIDGQPARTYPSGELALVTLDVPAGPSQVELRFGATPARTTGALLSTLAALAWIFLAWRHGRSKRLLRAAALALLLMTLLLGLNALGAGQRAWTPRPVQARMEDVAVLLASDARPAAGQEAVDVVLYWLALRENAADYKAFVHILGPDGSVVAQHDGDPGGGYTPTTRWRQGEIIADRHLIPLPAGLPAGDYGLRAGLYQVDPLRNLAVDPPAPDNRADLGPLTID